LNIAQLCCFQKDKLTTGQVGFEVEVEGTRLPQELRSWHVTRDGSLKGDGAREYVLKKPLSYLGFCGALTELTEGYERSNSNVRDTVRAGVHAHINVQDLSVVQLFNFITMSVLFENVLAEYCGKSRVGNLFCLRTTDAPYLLKVMQDVATTGNLSLFYTDTIRYSFINLKALLEHGSVEFRGMRSTRDMQALKRWAKILLRVRAASLDYANPTDMIDDYRRDSDAFVKRSLGPVLEYLATENMQELLDMGLRNAQEISYNVDWNKLDNPVCTNPFAAAQPSALSEKTGMKGLYPKTMPPEIVYLRPRRKGNKYEDSIADILNDREPSPWRTQGSTRRSTLTARRNTVSIGEVPIGVQDQLPGETIIRRD
jgi:hypothetical protein